MSCEKKRQPRPTHVSPRMPPAPSGVDVRHVSRTGLRYDMRQKCSNRRARSDRVRVEARRAPFASSPEVGVLSAPKSLGRRLLEDAAATRSFALTRAHQLTTSCADTATGVNGGRFATELNAVSYVHTRA